MSLSHDAFVRAYQAGSLRVSVDRAAAARLVSARLMLPFVLLPVMGVGVALALMGSLFSGIALFVGALVFRYLVRTTSQNFVLNRALEDPAFYAEVLQAGVLRLSSGE